MPLFRCKTRCFHINREYKPGEVKEFETNPGKHFEAVDKAGAVIQPASDKPVTLEKVTEADASLITVQVGKQPKKAK